MFLVLLMEFYIHTGDSERIPKITCDTQIAHLIIINTFKYIVPTNQCSINVYNMCREFLILSALGDITARKKIHNNFQMLRTAGTWRMDNKRICNV